MDSAGLRCPRRATWIVVHEPMTDGAPWIVERPGANPLRVSADIGELLSTMDGERNTAMLAGALGRRWTPALVDGAVGKLSELGLIEGQNSSPRPERRLVFIPPAILRFRLARAGSILEPLRPALTRLSGSAVLVTVLALSLAGLAALACQWAMLDAVLGAPLSMSSVALISTGALVTTIFHELSHGATLTYFRGRPGWFGVMFFYLMPACFCEVTDGWRLGKPAQRVAVAMAGVAAQTSIAGAAAVLALALPDGDGRSALIGFAVVCYINGVINLIPWVKLDGYLALMAYLDIPHLRDKAMADARGWLANRLFGVRFTRELPQLSWAIPYGTLCIGFPVLMLMLAVAMWCHLLLSVGVAGAVLILLLIGYLLYWLIRTTVGLLRKAYRAGVSLTRQVAAGVLVCLTLAAPLTFLNIRNDIRGGYIKDRADIYFVQPAGSDLAAPRPGERVVFQRSGLLFRTDLGNSKVGTGESVHTTVPLGALVPIRSDVPIDAIAVPLDGAPIGAVDTAGSAYLEGKPMPAGQWLADNYLRPAWQQIFGPESWPGP
ncbi:MAG: daptide biosynthesis intramembrane metalloprotease [Pseudonocardiaceae bacterium]